MTLIDKMSDIYIYSGRDANILIQMFVVGLPCITVITLGLGLYIAFPIILYKYIKTKRIYKI